MTDLEKAESYNGKFCEANGGPFHKDLIFILNVQQHELRRTTRQYYVIEFIYDDDPTDLRTWNMRLDELEKFLRVIA